MWGKVLCFGCGGMLGSAIYPYFNKHCESVLATDKRITASWVDYLDVRDYQTLREAFEKLKPDLVLHLAAETDLEFCEANAETAIDVNCDATAEIARLCKEFDATLVYISTAGVFDGTKEGYYTEEDPPNPIMIYGQTKYDGEQHVRAICDKYYVIRAGWMVGGGPQNDHKFINKILEQILADKKVIYAVTDKWGTPTYTDDFSRNLLSLLDSRQYGTYHMVCEGSGSRFDVAKKLLEICKRDDIKLEPVDSDFFKEDYFVPRPPSEMMTNENLRKLGLNQMRPWQEALEDYIQLQYPHAIELAEAVPINSLAKPQRVYRGRNRRFSNAKWQGIERRASA